MPLPLLAFFIVWIMISSGAGVTPPAYELWEWGGFIIGLLGMVIRALVGGRVPGGTSGRSTQRLSAGTLNTAGLYSVVRHPLYVGNYLMWLGVAVFTGSLLVVGLTTAVYALVYERIMAAEERFLLERFGDAYTDWAGRTPAFVPRFGTWVRPSLPFCWRSVLRREHSGMFALVVALSVIDLARNARHYGTPMLDPAWKLLLVATFLMYMVMRLLKRRTRLLHVAGR